MATNIPPHNLGEVIDGCLAMVENPEITVEEMMGIIPGPDFPTGAMIMGRKGINSAYLTGNGSVVMRARASFEEIGNRDAIIIHEIPYQVNKGKLLERLGEVGREKIVEDLHEIRDESDRDGVRIVIELKNNANPDVVLNQLYRHTALQSNFACNMVALHNGKPQTMILRDMIKAFVKFREEVITRRTIYELGKARERAHLLAGLAVAVANVDEVIAIIRGAGNPQEARDKLLAKLWAAGDVTPLIALIDDPDHFVDDNGNYQLSEAQVKAILDLRLHRLTGLERDKIGDELREITSAIAEYLAILASRERMLEVLVAELQEVKEKFATPRRSEMVEAEFEHDIEALIQREEMVVTITHEGYIKRVPLDTYRAQRRGGKGRSGMSTKDEDFVTDLFVANTHTPILFFTSRGIVHKMKVYQLPLGSPTSRGKALINLLPLEKEENISVYMQLPEDEDVWDNMDIMFATSHGSIRRNKLSDFKNIRANGLIAMKLGAGESMVAVKLCTEVDDIMLATRMGKAIRFPATDIRVFAGRNSTGVRGIKLARAGDEVISMSIVKDGEDPLLLTVSNKGYGKRTPSSEYRRIGRGGQGVTNMALTEKNGGEVVANFPVTDDHQIMLVTDKGQLIRTPVDTVRTTGRSAQGVTIFKVGKDENVVSVAWLIQEEEEEVLEAVDGEVVVEAPDVPVEPTEESDD
jgi:DNA gyrase subunit A